MRTIYYIATAKMESTGLKMVLGYYDKFELAFLSIMTYCCNLANFSNYRQHLSGQSNPYVTLKGFEPQEGDEATRVLVEFGNDEEKNSVEDFELLIYETNPDRRLNNIEELEI